jgi:hypothetical protein
MHVLDPDPGASDCPGNKLHLYWFIGVLATNRVIACSLIRNQNLACGEGTRLDYCDVIFAVDELDMTIITLGRLYFMLSCQLAHTDVALMLHGRPAAVRPQAI